jgi:hypothetical protein
MLRSSFAFFFVAAASLCGCAIRYDEAGLTRVGIGLWGFGDPPGVNWNLDWPPRREVPELPPMGPRDSLELPRVNRSPADETPMRRRRNIEASPDLMIDDNRCRAVHSDAIAHFAPLPSRADSHGSLAART